MLVVNGWVYVDGEMAYLSVLCTCPYCFKDSDEFVSVFSSFIQFISGWRERRTHFSPDAVRAVFSALRKWRVLSVMPRGVPRRRT